MTSSITDPVSGPEGLGLSGCRRWAIALAFLFLALYLPTLPSLSKWRGDEKFYTDAAIGMVKSGNYLTPTYGDGALRFRKPILTYWAVVAGYKVFGFNYFASRFLFLAAGAVVVWLCFELCLLLTGRPDQCLVATAILASNLTIQHVSTRSTPDILLCLFLLVSMVGFVGLIFHGLRTRWYVLAYFGAALASATKGFLGLLPVLYAFLYCACARPPGVRPRQLLHPWIVPVSALLASSWYLWAFSQHGDSATADFLSDQLGDRLSGNKLYILENAVVYLSSFFIQMLPWSLLAVLAFVVDRRGTLAILRQHKPVVWFSAGWVLLLYLVFVPANIQRTRYFLPAYPFLALWFGSLILQIAGSEVRPGLLMRSLTIFYGFAVFAGLGLGGFGLFIDPALSISGWVLSGTAALVWWFTRRLETPQKLVLASGWGVLAFSINLLLILPVFVSSPAPEMVRFCLSNPMVRGREIVPMSGVDAGYQSQVRSLSGGTLDPVGVPATALDNALREHGFVICSEKVMKDWNPVGSEIQKCATGRAPWKARDYIALLQLRDRQAAGEARKTNYFLVTTGEQK